MFKSSKRSEQKDKMVDGDVADDALTNLLLTRLIGKGRAFTRVDFKYTIFDGCYLRDCRFDSCNFTGCRFVGTNFHGSRFIGCIFDYATFERTNIDPEILDTNCPAAENLKMRFARTLRMNYQQLGDTAGANRAIKVELQATEIHLRKAWRSNESYYRKKYNGLVRVEMFTEWLRFKILDFIWGNGESVLKLLRFMVLLWLSIATIDFALSTAAAKYFGQSLIEAPQIFFGLQTPHHYAGLYLSAIALTRLVAIGFFLSIIIKRFNRR